MDRITSFRDLIDAYPSSAALADDLGVPRINVRLWKHRNSVPHLYWADAVRLYAKAGRDDVTFELLATLAADRRDAEAA